MSFDETNNVGLDFDLDSILSEFGELDEEPVSEMPYFEPTVPIKDEAPDFDKIFSAGIDTRRVSPTEEDIGEFDRDEILAEFASEDSVRGEEALDPEAVRREFASNDSIRPRPVSPAPIVESETDEPAYEDVLDDVDRIIAEFKQENKDLDLIIDPEPEPESEPDSIEISEPEPEPEPTRNAQPPEPSISLSEPSNEPTQLRVEEALESEDEAEEDELYEGSGIIEDSDSEYAADEDYTPEQEAQKKAERKRPQAKSFREAVAVPFISALAFIAMRVKQSQVTLSSASYEAEDLGEEMAPDMAARFYSRHIAGLRVRARIAFLLCALMIYISYGLPLPGAMADAGVKSAVCLIMLIAVMFCGLDIITTGIMSLVRLKMHASSLIAVSCLFCMVDGFLSAAGVGGKNVPFCVIPALTIAFTLLGCIVNARSNRIIFSTAAAAKNPYILTAESPITSGDITLVKGRRTADGFVRRTEEDGPDESVFGVLTPYFIIAAVILSIVAAAVTKSFASFAHILSGIFVCACPIAMLITFPLPFFLSAKGLIRSGSTIAGWSGLYDIGKAKHLIITDSDLFPKGCVRISRTRIFSGMEADRVISYAASIISASGSAMVHPFCELMKKADGALMPVEAFSVHESGGLTAMVDGEAVYCGNAAFMRLMGVVLPEKYVLPGGVYVAVAGRICGVFEMEYTASDEVREALGELVESGRHAIFAVRDFNITPSMLSVKFDMPTDGLDFPPYSERYEISGAEPKEDSKPAALISRDGLHALVSLADHGKMLFDRISLNVMLSVISAVCGIILMFILSLSALPSVTTALTYLLIWLVISIIISFSISTP